MKFRTVILQAGKNTTGIEVPDDVVSALGAGKKPPVTITLNGDYTYRSSIASLGGKFMIPLSAEHREASGIGGGDEVEVDVALDTAPREVTLPPDFAEALANDVPARESWNSLSYSNQRRHVLAIEDAKTPETRQRRIATSIETLHAGKQ
jgi:hypothetical protein